MADLHSFTADSRYIGFPVDDEACMYTFRVYPSDEMREGTYIMSSKFRHFLLLISHFVALTRRC
jgi:hypothetical protein